LITEEPDMIQKCFILGLAQIPEGFPMTDYLSRNSK